MEDASVAHKRTDTSAWVGVVLYPSTVEALFYVKMCYFSCLEFADETTKFFCKIYFAEEFRKMRELIFPSGEDR